MMEKPTDQAVETDQDVATDLHKKVKELKNKGNNSDRRPPLQLKATEMDLSHTSNNVDRAQDFTEVSQRNHQSSWTDAVTGAPQTFPGMLQVRVERKPKAILLVLPTVFFFIVKTKKCLFRQKREAAVVL